MNGSLYEKEEEKVETEASILIHPLLPQVLRGFCQHRLRFASSAVVTGQLTITLDNKAGSSLTVNVDEVINKLQDPYVSFVSNTMSKTCFRPQLQLGKTSSGSYSFLDNLHISSRDVSSQTSAQFSMDNQYSKEIILSASNENDKQQHFLKRNKKEVLFSNSCNMTATNSNSNWPEERSVILTKKHCHPTTAINLNPNSLSHVHAIPRQIAHLPIPARV